MSTSDHHQPVFCLSFTVFTYAPSILSFLETRIVEAHAKQLPAWFSQGCIRVDGCLVYTDLVLSEGQRVDLSIPMHKEAAVDVNWQLLWENDELMAVYKPHHLPVSRTTRNLYNTLISLIRRQTVYQDAQLLNRLDTETAGIVLLAKSREADKHWKPRLVQLMEDKTYHAWVWGQPSWDKLDFKCDLSEKTGSKIRSQMHVVDEEQLHLYPKPKFSHTLFEVIEQREHMSLVKCTLKTGRKHQIRAHLANLGYPVVGDKIYSFDGKYYLKRLQQTLTSEDYTALGADHQCLIAMELTLNLGSERRQIFLPNILKQHTYSSIKISRKCC